MIKETKIKLIIRECAFDENLTFEPNKGILELEKQCERDKEILDNVKPTYQSKI